MAPEGAKHGIYVTPSTIQKEAKKGDTAIVRKEHDKARATHTLNTLNTLHTPQMRQMRAQKGSAQEQKPRAQRILCKLRFTQYRKMHFAPFSLNMGLLDLITL